MVRTMSKKQQRKFGPSQDAVVERIEPPKPRRFVPQPCSACAGLRPLNTNYTRVNGTETKTNTDVELIIARACKCGFCGNTWTDYEVIKHANNAPTN